MNGVIRVPQPINEPVKSYAPGSPERASLKARLRDLKATEVEVPLIIGGEEVRTGRLGTCVIPHAHGHVLARYHKAGKAEVERAVAAAAQARRTWSRMPWHERAAVLLRAAELLAGPWRDTLNASTMLGQSKTAHQAEIDSACEVIDFWRFNPYFAQRIYEDQPISSPGMWNRVEYRALDGFVFAVTPFNFTSIGANLPTSPALMGNTVLWKPASTGVYPAYFNMKLLMAAGLPPGVINLVVGSGGEVGDPVLASPEFAGLHFTGSTAVFQAMWKSIGANMPRYRTYPRIVGETGGKDFVFAHVSADADALATALLRGAFEYQGQKCSAASRAYIPKALWPRVKDRLLGMLAEVRVGDIEDFTNFMGAVIDKAAFESIKEYIEYARAASDAEILFGGVCDDSVGYFIQPTIVRDISDGHTIVDEEQFGPILPVIAFSDVDDVVRCVNSSEYGLGGSIWSKDVERAAAIAERIESGQMWVNQHIAIGPHIPMAGFKNSGLGVEQSVEGLAEYTQLQVINIKR
ncbi:MAG: L-glutamate gamma-semialdehyde dehydrogenase [Acidobacteriota bacterium]